MISNTLEQKIQYKTNTALFDDVNRHLSACDKNFIPHLSQKVNIAIYAKKIVENSVTFEAWYNAELVGLIAAYCNDVENKKVFITNVSTITQHLGKGIASTLIKQCIEYATKNKFTEILLEVNSNSINALKLYSKNNFIQTGIKNETIIMQHKLN